MNKPLFCLVLALVTSQWLAAQNPLFLPETISGEEIHLEVREGTHHFFPGISTATLGVNGDILGPVILLERGKQVTLHVHNQLPDVTTMHWHGLHVAPDNDGGPHLVIPPGTVWSPSFEVMDHAGTYWYHPHLHERTNEQVSKGLAGMIIVRDNEESALPLPRRYGQDDFPVIIQTKDFDAGMQILHTTNSDDVLLVNATLNPYLDVPAQVVRLRILNGSSMRTFHLGLEDNRPFYLIGTDGGLLEKPVQRNRQWLSPGERAEILIDLGGLEGQNLALRSYASELPNGVYGATFPGMGPGLTLNGYNPNPLNGADFTILQLQVGPALPDAIHTIPDELIPSEALSATQADTIRPFVFTPMGMGNNPLNGDFLINNQPFDMEVINEIIPLGNIEIWALSNQSPIAHPFHVHLVQFYILDRNGIPPAPHEQGRKDVVLVRPAETVRIIAHFTDFASEEWPYMYHCHMLLHEDHHMMGQFLVVDKSTSIPHVEARTAEWVVTPNPGQGRYRVTSPAGGAMRAIDAWNVHGQKVSVYWQEEGEQQLMLDISHAGTGVFYCRITRDQEVQTVRIMQH